MAGLLDWLTEGMGTDMGGAPAPPGTRDYSTALFPPLPPRDPNAPQGSDPMTAGGTQFPPGADPMTAGGAPSNGPGLPYPPGADPMTAGGAPSNGPGLPYPPGGDPMTAGGAPPMTPPPPVPLPMSRPPSANAAPPPIPLAAPGAAPPPSPPIPLMPPNVAPSPAPGGPQGMISRALGLDRNTARTMSGSLASGLKSVGDNVHKPGLAAFAGSAGSALEGGNTAENKIGDEQTKYLTQAIAAAQAGNTAALNVARTKLALAQAKAAEEGDPAKTELSTARTRLATAQARKIEEGGGTKESVVNSPEQLYLRAIAATNGDGKLSLLKNTYIQASKDGQQDTPAAKAAKAAYEKAYDETRDGHLKTLGVDPKIAGKIGKQPGFSADNPIPSAGLTAEKFNALPVGTYFINPKDGKLLIKQPPAGANPPPAASSPTPPAPPTPPVPVTAPAGSAADDDE